MGESVPSRAISLELGIGAVMALFTRCRVWSSFLIGKMLLRILRLIGRRGTALPGRVIEAVHPRFVRDVIGDRPVIMITGTNGKTTTATAIRSMYRADGKVVIGNDAGSNMMRGIIGSLLAAGKMNTRNHVVYVFEIEEATLPKVIALIIPTLVIVTNLFRDQLDAYGELAHTASLIHGGLKQLPSTSMVLLTADDPTVLSLQRDLHAQVKTIGLATRHGRSSFELQDAADAIFCPTCASALEYERIFYNHLGIYRCPAGHCQRPADPDVVIERTERQVKVEMGQRSITVDAKSLPLYMLYNIGTAIAAGIIGSITPTKISAAITDLEPAFGRGESFEAPTLRGTMYLIKNPAGANAIIASLLDQPVDGIWIILNDDTADGKDVSWIWDADWELLATTMGPIWLGGRRSWDLALRLKYAGVESSRLHVARHHEETWAQIAQWSTQESREQRSIAILPTYTALLSVHHFLEEKKLVKGWS